MSRRLHIRILILAVIGVLAVIFWPGLSQAQGWEEFQRRPFVSVGVGLANGSEQVVDDLYGTLPAVRLAGGSHFSRHFRLELGVMGAYKNGKTLKWNVPNGENLAELSLFLLEGHVMLQYLARLQRISFYLGAGGVVGVAREHILLTSRSYGGYEEQIDSHTSVTAVGPTGLAGLEYHVSAVTNLYAQAAVTSLERESVIGQNKFSTLMFELGCRVNVFSH